MADLQLYQLLYPLALPPRPRTKPMRVLALGLPRSGTDSLRVALGLLGYGHVYHGFDHVDDMRECAVWVELFERKAAGELLTAADFDRVLGHCDAVTDYPCAAFAPDLIRAYPDARVVVNRRMDIDAWHASVVATWSAAQAQQAGLLRDMLTYFDARMFWLRQHEARITQGPRGLFRGDYRRFARDAYRDHYALLDKVVPPGRTLHWSVEQGWEPLCRFLGKDVPDEPFPNRNALDAVLKRVITAARQHGQVAFLKMVLVLGSVVAAMGGVAWYYFASSSSLG